AERAERREPPDADARRPAEVRQAVAAKARADELRELRRRRGPAKLVFEVPGIARVEEGHAANADLVDDRKLELEVRVVAQVSADVRAVGDRRRVDVERLVQREAGAQRAQAVAAEVQ